MGPQEMRAELAPVGRAVSEAVGARVLRHKTCSTFDKRAIGRQHRSGGRGAAPGRGAALGWFSWRPARARRLCLRPPVFCGLLSREVHRVDRHPSHEPASGHAHARSRSWQSSGCARAGAGAQLPYTAFFQRRAPRGELQSAARGHAGRCAACSTSPTTERLDAIGAALWERACQRPCWPSGRAAWCRRSRPGWPDRRLRRGHRVSGGHGGPVFVPGGACRR